MQNEINFIAMLHSVVKLRKTTPACINYRPQMKLWEGNVSFCSREVSLCIMSLPLWLSGPMFLLGGSLSLVPCSFQWVSVSGTMFLLGGLCRESP